jgi:hypothetical protein
MDNIESNTPETVEPPIEVREFHEGRDAWAEVGGFLRFEWCEDQWWCQDDDLGIEIIVWDNSRNYFEQYLGETFGDWSWAVHRNTDGLPTDANQIAEGVATSDYMAMIACATWVQRELLPKRAAE